MYMISNYITLRVHYLKLYIPLRVVKEESKTAAQDLLKLRKKSKAQDKRGYSLVASSTEGPIDELFQFIGSDPDKAVSSKPSKLVQLSIYSHPPHRATDFQVQNMFFLTPFPNTVVFRQS